MGNFGHALKLTLRHRMAVAGTLICSLLVAVLWGGNIGALYPVIQVAFQGRSLQSWIGDEVKESQATV
ncbi:MAG: ABC transporter ATP-binding protein, partial [Planctomycetales bacterium]|nr:ABC transporter ATP-binding protein [Planctomycetales bacterium]